MSLPLLHSTLKSLTHESACLHICVGALADVGGGKGTGTTLNIPLPPGSGGGAYRAVFDRVVAPALDAFQPQLILVSSGFDASFFDPLAAQMCNSEDYRCAWQHGRPVQRVSRAVASFAG